MRSYLVTRWHPSSFLDELFSVLVDFGSSFGDFVNGSLLPWSGTLNITQCLFEAPQFHLNLGLCLLSISQSDLLEALNRPQLLVDIVSLWLESLVVLLDLVNDLGVLENGTVRSEIDLLRLVLKLLEFSASVVVTLLEVCERGGCLASETKLGSNFGPVELCGSALSKFHVSLDSNSSRRHFAPKEASSRVLEGFKDIL